ncbi:hypothetical protein ACR303_01365 [Bacillus paralicheniformis]|nr:MULTISPECIES: hypothetical protein [Bacillus]WMW49798.1 hypothetical protein RFN66_16285 [Bacillus paralicheniformis]
MMYRTFPPYSDPRVRQYPGYFGYPTTYVYNPSAHGPYTYYPYGGVFTTPTLGFSISYPGISVPAVHGFTGGFRED